MIIAVVNSMREKSCKKGKLIEFREQYICRVYFPKNLDGEKRKYDI
jgi:hypothetical protein